MTASYRFGRFELRPVTRQLLVDDQPTPLGERAFDVLLALIERRERVVTKEELLDLGWPGLVVEENNLQVQVSALRKVLGNGAIATVARRGYRFTVQVRAEVPPHATQSLETRPVADVADKPSIAVLPFVNMYRAGIELRQIQKLLGHKSVKTTEIYLRARAGEKVTPTK